MIDFEVRGSTHGFKLHLNFPSTQGGAEVKNARYFSTCCQSDLSATRVQENSYPPSNFKKVVMFRNCVNRFNKPDADVKCKDLTCR